MRWILLVFLAVSCGCFRAPDVAAKLEVFQRESREANNAKIKAEQRANDADKSVSDLKTEKKDLLTKAAEAEAQAREYRAQAAEKQKEINQARLERIQTTCYWLAGIAIFLALVAGAVAIWLPLVRKLALTFAVSAAGFAALALFLAWIVPYLIWIGCILAAGGVIAVIVWWVRDHKTAAQVIEAVEGLKPKIPEYKEHFRQYIDSGIDLNVNRIRQRIIKIKSKGKK